MKRILSLLGVLGLSTTGVSCVDSKQINSLNLHSNSNILKSPTNISDSSSEKVDIYSVFWSNKNFGRVESATSVNPFHQKYFDSKRRLTTYGAAFVKIKIQAEITKRLQKVAPRSQMMVDWYVKGKWMEVGQKSPYEPLTIVFYSKATIETIPNSQYLEGNSGEVNIIFEFLLGGI